MQSKNTYLLYMVLAAMVLLASCRKQEKATDIRQEDLQAKEMLQGVWISAEDESPLLMARGDSIFYPDSTSMPVAFRIVSDTLFLTGSQTIAYPIERQTENLFDFRNANGDLVRMMKSNDANDFDYFEMKEPVVLNQRRLIKRDTIVAGGGANYHCYVQVNPTTFKVVKQSYNESGMEVGNVYYDNIVHFAVFKGAQKIFSRDFRKQDFARQLPQVNLQETILSDMEFAKTADDGIHYYALMGVPDTDISYIVEVTVSYQGKLSLRLSD